MNRVDQLQDGGWRHADGNHSFPVMIDGEVYRCFRGIWLAIDLYTSGLVFVGDELDANDFSFDYRQVPTME